MKNIYFLFIVLVPFCSISQKFYGQKLIDSLLVELPKMKEDSLKVNTFYNISWEYQYIEPKKGIYYGKKIIELSKKLNWNEGISKGLHVVGVNQHYASDFKNAIKNFNLAISHASNTKSIISNLDFLALCYKSTKNYPKALSIFNQSLTLAEKIKDLKLIQTEYNNIGIFYYDIKNFPKSIEFYKKALLISRKNKDNDSEYIALANIAGSYSKSNNLKQSLYYEQQALDIGLKNKFNFYVTDTYVRIGTGFNNLKEYNYAIKNFEKALEIDKEINDFYNSSVCYEGIGISYFEKKKYNLALKYFNKAKKINITNDVKKFIATNSTNLGKTYFELSKEINKTEFLKKSILNFTNAIKVESEIGDLENISLNYSLLSESYKLLGNYKEALNSHEQYMIYKDSVFNSDNKETIKNLEDKREIELRDKEIKINKLSLEAKEKQKWYLLGGLGLLTIIGGLLFYQSRKRKQINSKLQILNKNLDSKNLELDQANKAKTRFFSILNHDLRGPVNNLIFFLQLQNEAPELLTEENTKRMQDKTMSGAKNLLASMEDILQWSKSQMENFKPQPENLLVNQLFEDTKKVFSGYLKITFEYQNPDNIEIFTDENYLKTIIRNLTSNAINSFTTTENPSITWKAWQSEKQRFLSVTDNGTGINEEKLKALFDESEFTGTKSGLGLYLIRDMAKAINCEIEVDSKLGEGTTFTLKF